MSQKKNGKVKKPFLQTIGVLLLVLLLGLGEYMGILPEGTAAQLDQTPEVTLSASNAEVTPTPLPDGPVIDPQSIADYLFAHGKLPDNFITKAQAQQLGWDSSRNDVSDVAPGMSIGGDRFGNYEGLLPKAKGRQYYEADCYYTGGNRNAHRIVFSNDGLVFYTSDHYETFVEMFPTVGTPRPDIWK